ncbi:MAG: hypothetical protein JWP35_91 [Caulobacter sp.]|nr:hypothetical protein [Caulobacter sp.]
MLRLVTVLTAMFGLWLAGCAHERADAHSLAWRFLSAPGEDARLAYGQPDSDDVAMMFTCEPGGRTVRLSAATDSRQDLTLVSRGSSARLDAAPEEGLPGGPSRMAAVLPSGDKTLASFADSGRLRVKAGKQSAPLDAVGADREEVRRFFAACAAASPSV